MIGSSKTNSKKTIVFQVGPVYETSVLSRPSKVIRSPYMADISNPDHSSSEMHVLAHSPSLGVSGLVAQGSRVIVTCRNKSNITAKSKYTIDGVVCQGKKKKPMVIGVNPMYANKIIETVLNNHLFEEWTHITEWQKEKTVQQGKSRFDFVGHNHQTGNMVVIEVKSVPLVDSHQVAIFPEGYRKTKESTVSERAVKHLRELSDLVKSNTKISAYMVYVIQRGDAEGFLPGPTDPIYRDAFQRAKEAGVCMVAMMVDPTVVCHNKECELQFSLTKIWFV